MVLAMTKAALLYMAYIYQFGERIVSSSFFSYSDIKTCRNMRSMISSEGIDNDSETWQESILEYNSVHRNLKLIIQTFCFKGL
jgi:hypothetical protein